MDGLGADFYCTIVSWTEVFIVSSRGKILLFLQPKGGWILSKKRIDRLY